MLRENLDTVLKDLLEFKSNEQVKSSYPGSHLDIKNNFLKEIVPAKYKETFNAKIFPKTIKTKSEEIINTESIAYPYEVNFKSNNNGFHSRIRRYLSEKSRNVKPERKVTYNFSKYFSKKLRGIKTPANSKETTKTKQHRKNDNSRNNREHGRKLQIYTPLNRRHVRDLNEIKTDINRFFKNSNDDPTQGDAALKARFLFKSCMNYEILQKRGHQPLLDLLNLLGGWPILNPIWNEDGFDWLELMAKLRLYNNDILITEWVGPDIKNSDEYVIQFDQTSLGM